MSVQQCSNTVVMPLTYVTSEKGGKAKLVENGYAYIRDKTNGDKVFLKCDKSRSYKCHARLQAENDIIKTAIRYGLLPNYFRYCHLLKFSRDHDKITPKYVRDVYSII